MSGVEAYSGFAIVKPQVAFFEAYGAAGYSVLETTMAELRDAGVLVLADAKRGDIGTTMAAYAAAWVGDAPLACDAVTASPYLGFGSLRPCSTWPPSMAAACSSWLRHPIPRARAYNVPWPTGEPSLNRSSMTWAPRTAVPGRVPSVSWSAPRCPTCRTSASSTGRCWCRGSALRVVGQTRSAGSAGRRRNPASCGVPRGAASRPRRRRGARGG